MEPGKIPTKEEVVRILETVKNGLPELIEKAKQGTFETVEEEGMIVLNLISKKIISVAVKEHTIHISHVL